MIPRLRPLFLIGMSHSTAIDSNIQHYTAIISKANSNIGRSNKATMPSISKRRKQLKTLRERKKERRTERNSVSIPPLLPASETTTASKPERYWCGCKWYARENCQYSLDGLRETVPAALSSVSSATIHRHYLHCMRIIEAYGCGVTDGLRNSRSGCIRVTGRLLTSQSGNIYGERQQGTGWWQMERSVYIVDT